MDAPASPMIFSQFNVTHHVDPQVQVSPTTLLHILMLALMPSAGLMLQHSHCTIEA